MLSVSVMEAVGNASPMDLRPEHLERQARLRAVADGDGLAGVIALGRGFYDRPGPCAWLTGHYPAFLAAAPYPGLRGAGHAALVLPIEGTTTLLCDPTGAREDLVASDDIRSTDDLWGGLANALRAHGLAHGKVGIAGYDLLPAPVAGALARDLPGLELRPFDAEVDRLRQIKSPNEQVLLARAAACADSALADTIEQLRRGASEREAGAAGCAAALAAGADHVRYVRVHSGVWSERIARWPPALDRVPLEGELVMVDVIGARAGYAFDVARTILLGEAPTAARELLDACATACDAGALACRAGATVHDVLAAAHEAYERAGLAGHARTFAGHGIGIETVEFPLLAPASGELELTAGMTLCVEPGITVPGVGGALIEHEVIVGEGAPRFLCATPSLS
jgi:Xaa-Pro aminopeptidase